MPNLHRVCLFSVNTTLWAFGKQHTELWRAVQLPDGLHERGAALGAAAVWLGAMRHVIKCLDLGRQGQTGSLALLGALAGGSVETLALTFWARSAPARSCCPACASSPSMAGPRFPRCVGGI